MKAILFFVFIFLSSLSTQANLFLEVREFFRGKEKFYAIAMSQWTLAPEYAEAAEKAPRGSGPNIPEVLLDIQKIFFEGHRLADAPDFRDAMRSERGALWPRLSDAIAAPSAAQENGIRILEAYANYFKWKEYADRRTIPGDLDFEQLKKESPLLRDGTTVILILDSRKNFAGMVSVSYPTEKYPDLPAQELHQKLVEAGLESPFTEIKNPLTEKDLAEINQKGRILETGYIKEFYNLGETYGEPREGTIQQVQVDAPFTHRSLMVELKSIVKKPQLYLEIMTWATYLLDTMRIIPFQGDSTLVNNGPGPKKNHHAAEGFYLATASERLFRVVHERNGWKLLAKVGETIFMTLTREGFLNLYRKGQFNVHKGVDFMSQVFQRAQQRDVGWEPNLKGMDRESKEITREIKKMLALPRRANLSCRKAFRKK